MMRVTEREGGERRGNRRDTQDTHRKKRKVNSILSLNNKNRKCTLSRKEQRVTTFLYVNSGVLKSGSSLLSFECIDTLQSLFFHSAVLAFSSSLRFQWFPILPMYRWLLTASSFWLLVCVFEFFASEFVKKCVSCYVLAAGGNVCMCVCHCVCVFIQKVQCIALAHRSR